MIRDVLIFSTVGNNLEREGFRRDIKIMRQTVTLLLTNLYTFLMVFKVKHRLPFASKCCLNSELSAGPMSRSGNLYYRVNARTPRLLLISFNAKMFKLFI